MNDLATYEIFWHFLYLTVFHGVELTADGKYSKAGDRVTPELFIKLLDERRETVKDLFKKLGTVYEKTNAELVLQLLKRQVVEERNGRLMPQSRWIKYGSRVLLSIIEESDADRSAILDGIFSATREELAARAAQAGDPATRARAEKVLRAHDFVYDSPEESSQTAA